MLTLSAECVILRAWLWTAKANSTSSVGEDVTRLYRRDNIPDADCWLRGKGWCLALSEPAG